jgi:cyclic GMP-AMP synthase DncV-like protein
VLDTSTDLIAHLLEGAVEALDIPEDLRATAVREYEHMGTWLADHADDGNGWYVYPQGSFSLGTVVRPEGRDEYDLDAVCQRDIAKESTTQVALKTEVGDALDDYVEAREGDSDGPEGCDERKRCWTLSYPVAFHLDVLPAIPSVDGSPTGILLTDKKLRRWQYSDPIAYGNWFKGRMAAELVAKRLRLAEAARVEPAAIPEASVKTTLQLVVQVLKAHRNQFFAHHLERRPASILITTLAGHAYLGERNLERAVLETVGLMPDYIERDGGRWVVRNPVEPRENFADKWEDEPELAASFFEWLDQLSKDLRESSERRGIDRVAARLAESFGAEPIEKAASVLGDTYRGEREAGRLRFAPTTGVLSGAGAMPVRSHDFYGNSGAR